MHRSNTSYISNVIHNAGFYMGENLIPESEHNKKGHFEDQDIVDFHKSLLLNNGLTSKWNYVNPNKLDRFNPSSSIIQQAKKLLKSKTENHDQFCWKDPRNCHFLNLWKEVSPQIKYLFIIRHPQASVDSLINRSLSNKTINYRPDLYYRLHRFWRITNQQILDFYLLNRASSILMITPAFITNKKFENKLNDLLIDKWQFDIKPVELESIYDPKLITSQNNSSSRGATESLRLYDKLVELAKI